MNATINGTADRLNLNAEPRQKNAKTKQVKQTKPTGRRSGKAYRNAISARQRIALAVGGVGCAVLLLSVWHCTEALALLTGAPLLLAALLAIGIDAGMVACEVATVVSSGKARSHARLYVGLAVALSAVLNAVASAQHASEGFVALAYAVGAIVPVLVLILGSVASHLWTER